MTTDVYTKNRALLFGIAYRMIGSVAEAEDLVQETFVRWQRQDAATIESPKAWLVATLTRLGIDHLRSARHRREEYVGVWLPEPLVDATAPAPDEVAALGDSLGMAFLFMLETLGPVERAVFLLREAFDYDYEEIATIVGRSEAACRQIVSRAKSRFAQREPAQTAPTRKAEQIVQRFMNACATGSVSELLAVLTDDAILYADGGGRGDGDVPVDRDGCVKDDVLRRRRLSSTDDRGGEDAGEVAGNFVRRRSSRKLQIANRKSLRRPRPIPNDRRPHRRLH
jgi:RNA polymerase sigma-70 factor (ECF subfamily)